MTEGKRMNDVRRSHDPKADREELAGAPASYDPTVSFTKTNSVCKTEAIGACYP